MKSILNFKIIKLLYVNVIIIAFLSPTYEGIGGGLKAQTSDILLNSGWFLAESNVNGVSISLEDSGGFQFYSPHTENYFIHLYGNSCFESFKVTYTDVTETSFNLDAIVEYISCNYTDPDEIEAVELYQSFYFELPFDANSTPKNPFTYEWADGGFPVMDLIITNSVGDWLLYRTAFLSTPTFHQNSFTMYPNPVKENLSINNTSNQSVKATIYDVSGNALQKQLLVANTSIINVKSLNTGLYFVVFENESGERVSKKFVKR